MEKTKTRPQVSGLQDQPDVNRWSEYEIQAKTSLADRADFRPRRTVDAHAGVGGMSARGRRIRNEHPQTLNCDVGFTPKADIKRCGSGVR